MSKSLLKNPKRSKEVPYKIGTWYKVTNKYIIASAEAPEWGLISVPKRSGKGFDNKPGWKPRGRLYRIKKGEMVMIVRYLHEDTVAVIGIGDKFLYTDASELERVRALEECNGNA